MFTCNLLLFFLVSNHFEIKSCLSFFWSYWSADRPHPRAYPMPGLGCAVLISHEGPAHFGSWEIGLVLILYAWRWHGSQKWVLPQQNQIARLHQSLHLYRMKSEPCTLQFVLPHPGSAGLHLGQRSYSKFKLLMSSWSPSARSFGPKKYASWHLKHKW